MSALPLEIAKAHKISVAALFNRQPNTRSARAEYAYRLKQSGVPEYQIAVFMEIGKKTVRSMIDDHIAEIAARGPEGTKTITKEA